MYEAMREQYDDVQRELIEVKSMMMNNSNNRQKIGSQNNLSTQQQQSKKKKGLGGLLGF